MERITAVTREVARVVGPIVGLFAYSVGTALYAAEPQEIAHTVLQQRLEARPVPATTCDRYEAVAVTASAR